MSDRGRRIWNTGERALRRFNDAISAVFTALSVVLLLVIVGLVFGNVVARTLLNTSIPWSGEASVFALLWMVFLGAVVGYRRKMFPAFTGLVDLLPTKWSRAVRVVVLLVNMLAAVTLLLIGLDFARASLPQSSPVLGMKLGLVYLAIPVAGLAMIPVSLELIVDALRGETVELGAEAAAVLAEEANT